MGGASNLPVAAVSLLLVILFIGSTWLIKRYYAYLIRKNRAQDPEEPRWTLALVDSSPGGSELPMDIDSSRFDFAAPKCFWPSLRTQIEQLVSGGEYLTFSEARERLQCATNPICNFRIAGNGGVGSIIRHLALVDGDADSGPWRLAPLAVTSKHGGTRTSEVDISSLRKQVADICEHLFVGTADRSDAEAVVWGLSLAVVALQPGESSSANVEGFVSQTMRTCCFSKVNQPNDTKDFTSMQMTKGETAHLEGCVTRIYKQVHPAGGNSRPGNGLPFAVTALPKIVGTVLLLCTWAAFVPGWGILPETHRHAKIECRGSSTTEKGGEMCHTEKVKVGVEQVRRMTRQRVKYVEAQRQNWTTANLAVEIKKHVQKYHSYQPPSALNPRGVGCHYDMASDGELLVRPGPAGRVLRRWKNGMKFPDWCANRIQSELNDRRQCCTPVSLSGTAKLQPFKEKCLEPKMHSAVKSTANSVGFKVSMCLSQFIKLDGHSTGVTLNGYSSAKECAGYDNAATPPKAPHYATPCPPPVPGVSMKGRLDSEQRAASEYIKIYNQRKQELTHNIEFPFVNYTALKPLQERVAEIASTINTRSNTATSFYIWYVVARVWLPSALVISRSNWKTGLRRTAFGLSKRNFVILVLVVWFLSDIVQYIEGLDIGKLKLYWRNIAVEPCFTDTRFMRERLAAISDVCKEMQKLAFDVTDKNRTISYIHEDIGIFSPYDDSNSPRRRLPHDCGCEYPGANDVRRFLEKFVAPIKNCCANGRWRDKNRSRYLLHASRAVCCGTNKSSWANSDYGQTGPVRPNGTCDNVSNTITKTKETLFGYTCNVSGLDVPSPYGEYGPTGQYGNDTIFPLDVTSTVTNGHDNTTWYNYTMHNGTADHRGLDGGIWGLIFNSSGALTWTLPLGIFMRPFVGNMDFCADAAAQHDMLNPEQPTIDWLNTWNKGGAIAEFILKVTLANLLYALIGFANPLSFVAGDAIFHGLISVICILNLGWIGTKDALDGDEAQTVTVAGAPTDCKTVVDQDHDVVLTFLLLGSAVLAIVLIVAAAHFIRRAEAKIVKKQHVVNILRQPSRQSSTLAAGSKWRIAQKGMSSFEHENAAGGSKRPTTPDRSTLSRLSKASSPARRRRQPPAAPRRPNDPVYTELGVHTTSNPSRVRSTTPQRTAERPQSPTHALPAHMQIGSESWSMLAPKTAGRPAPPLPKSGDGTRAVSPARRPRVGLPTQSSEVMAPEDVE